MKSALQRFHTSASARSGVSPSVSVITPIYNRSEFLPAVIETLERQTLKDFELIIVDDGSSEGLANAVRRLQVSFSLRLVRLDLNLGAASARNAGIKAAQGRYVAFLDSDDSWHPDKLRRQLRQLESAPDRHLLVSLTRQLVIGGRSYVAPRRMMIRGMSVGQYLFQSSGIIQSSMMFMPAELAKSVRFVDGARGHDDWSFALRLEAVGARFEMLPQALTIYNDERARVRRSPAYSSARFSWLEQWRDHLGEAPYLAARAAFVSHMGHDRALKAPAMIATAFIRGAIPAWRAAYYAATWALPWMRTCGVVARTTWLRLNNAAEKDELSPGAIDRNSERNRPKHP